MPVGSVSNRLAIVTTWSATLPFRKACSTHTSRSVDIWQHKAHPRPRLHPGPRAVPQARLAPYHRRLRHGTQHGGQACKRRVTVLNSEHTHTHTPDTPVPLGSLDSSLVPASSRPRAILSTVEVWRWRLRTRERGHMCSRDPRSTRGCRPAARETPRPWSVVHSSHCPAAHPPM